MDTRQGETPHEYALSERRFIGSSEEVVQQLDELIEALLAFRQSLSIRGGPERALPAVSPVGRRGGALAAMVIAAVLLGLAAATAFGQSAPTPPPATSPAAAAQQSGQETLPHLQFGVTLEGYCPDDLRESQDTVLVGLVWWFGTKQGAW